MSDTAPAQSTDYVAPSGPLWEGLDPPYRTIVADPPWRYEVRPTGFQGGPRKDRPRGGVRVLPYQTLDLQSIIDLSVAELAASDAHLYLWTTSRYLKDAHDVAKAWGFRYSQTLTWCKKPSGLGPGGAFSSTAEFVLFCRRGKLAPLARADSTWWLWPRRAHSVKPSEFYDLVEKVSPGPYLDLFARGKRLGWDGWGNEYGGAA